MLSLDDRAGNVLTTVALFMAAAAILYMARRSFLVLLVSILFAYLLEPAVTFVQEHWRLGHQNRALAITLVYVIATVVIGSMVYELGPHLVEQFKKLAAALPAIMDGFSTERIITSPGTKFGLSVNQQQGIQNLFVRSHDFIATAFERSAAYLSSVAASAVWLFPIPILAAFVLRDGRHIEDALIKAVERGGDGTAFKNILRRIDTMLASYIRAQLALASLSFIFYSGSMLILRFPYAIALGFLGGVLEFLPAVGWVTAAAAILTIGFLTHSHWIWMAGLIVVWRLVQDYVNSPRIMGHNLDLRPLTVVFALLVGGELGGIAGIFLSVPATAMLRIIWLECFPPRNSKTIAADQALLREKTS